MKPIPRRLLIHKAVLVTETTDADDVFGGKSAETTTELSHIRVEPSSSLTVGKQNEQVRVAAVLFYDCRNSRPAGIEFPHSARVEFAGEKYNIVGVKKYFDERCPHHYEVELCL